MNKSRAFISESSWCRKWHYFIASTLADFAYRCSKNLAPTAGPQLGSVSAGPAAIPPALAAGASTPGGSTAFSGSIISAGPSAPSAPAAMLHNPQGYDGNYMPYADQPAFDPSMFNMPNMPYQGASPAGLPSRPMDGTAAGGIHPSRLAAMGGAGALSPMGMPMGMPPQIAGQTRPYEDGQTGQGPPKRPRIAKLPGGQFYPVSATATCRRTIS